MYNVEIKESSRELTKKERVALKTGSFEVIDKLAPITISPVGYAVLHVQNTESKENPEYDKYIIFADDGKMYATGSDPFFRQFLSIYEEMEGDEYEIEIVKVPSRNREGKYFLSCNIL